MARIARGGPGQSRPVRRFVFQALKQAVARFQERGEGNIPSAASGLSWGRSGQAAPHKLGGLLKGMEKAGGGQPSKNRQHDVTGFPPTLADQGIDKMAASRWQTISTLPEARVEEYLEACGASGLSWGRSGQAAPHKLGGLLKRMEKRTGGDAAKARTRYHDVTKLPPSLKAQGIEKMAASRWQTIARLPEARVEEYLEACGASGLS
ncbi:MAG: hypothetical protein RDU83_06210 [bacterium]|nr:hypothetical protein [bacterium]